MDLPDLIRVVRLAMVASVAWVCTDAWAAEPGIDAGARLFVTKVYPGHGALADADFQQLADAGFTAVVNRWSYGHDGQPVIDSYIQGAATAGLDAVAWRGGLADTSHSGDQTVTYEGNTTRYTLPYSAQGWSEITQNAVTLAQQSLTSPNFKAVFLDFEIYDSHATNGFAESYDDGSFNEFFRQRGESTPEVSVSQRRGWLSSQTLLDDYITLQANYVGARARQLRQAIDQVNPDFQIGVYGHGPLIDAVKRNVASNNAPVVDLDAYTYGRSEFDKSLYERGYDADRPDDPGLKWSLLNVSERAREAQQRSYPVVLLGGHYAQSAGPEDGSQYRFTVRQSFNSAAYADGYWVWTDWGAPQEWPGTRAEWINAMMEYFAQANHALVSQDYTWSSRQLDSITDPLAEQPKVVLTTDGQTVKAWNPLTGELGTVNQSEIPDDLSSWLDTALGNADTIAGNEYVVLNDDGWLTVADPGTGLWAEILRFQVGYDQTGVVLVDAEFIAVPEPGVSVIVFSAFCGCLIPRRFMIYRSNC